MQEEKRPNIKVFIVEDQSLLRETLQAMLELEVGIEVIGVAEDAEQALNSLEVDQADVVLMDVMLPGIDGIEATKRLKERCSDQTIVILTTYGSDYFELALQAGATSYLPKSCTREQLVQTVQAAHQGQIIIDSQLASSWLRELDALRQSKRENLLTPRQIEVLRLVADGTKYRDIAEAMFLNERTVNREMRNIFDRLGVDDASHAVAEAYQNGII